MALKELTFAEALAHARTLKKCKEYSEDRLATRAKALMAERHQRILARNALEAEEKLSREIDINSLLSDQKERNYAKQLLIKYLQEYSIISIGEKETLRDLLFLEIIGRRMRERINVTSIDHASYGKLVTDIHKNNTQIADLKQALGLIKDRKSLEASDSYKKWRLLEEKTKQWMEDNQASRTMKCPNCSKFMLLRIRTDRYESGKHPFFKDTTLYNKHAINLYRAGTITKQDVADILLCPTDYVDWLLERIAADGDT